ncbi:protein-disulfide isomerase [Acidovorax sp. 62]|uniref:DsbA family protein n=1 Tax=Acidovorax sp. 62 TaxID=2035203 RepID=UPI000C18DAEF|nr:thioredoxin domain-containing protein [Acidovorax sp. 62]PIF90470.1 protein-disulfide isomerase [Acidovorax sp. 62]TFI48712.1 disulfide bond formation protein DsbA [Diaphorobacter sp. DS2]
MKHRKLIIFLVLGMAFVAFLVGVNLYQSRVQSAQELQVAGQAERLVRMHSPVIGPREAPVTIVEFFDPACETCRAFYPVVKELMQQYPTEVRLVIRYAPFHQGSEQVVKLLESARRQDKYLAVLEAVLAAQPQWADHGAPNLELAYKAAEQAGLDMQRARADIAAPALDAVVLQDVQDLTALKVEKTPTFFVNGRPLPSFGHKQLTDLVAQEVSKTKK